LSISIRVPFFSTLFLALLQHDDSTLKSKCCLKLGEWQQTLAGEGKESMVHVLNSFHLATQV
jgi:hypothetical protein